MKLSRAEKLLIASGNLHYKGKEEFTAEDLIVQAFQDFPNDFALKGYIRFPDSNSVLTQIMGKKAPLFVRGWLEKTGTKQYRLTSKGLHDLSQISSNDVEISSSIHIERKKEEEFGRLLTSSAYEMFKDGQKDNITFHNFSRFVGLSARDKWQKVVGKMKLLKYLIGEIVTLGESGQSLNIHFRNRNYHFIPDDLLTLRALYEYLLERFKKEMQEWEYNAKNK